ncbi:hypothetical protein AAFF_G00224240 [Aldrovandia affinis]|uniref:Uncharacterized protein n=1 Tax=Aldrovandia affinis TaxID=143900 RepID=A0AAD7X1E4_9TELE|nr:hypothetical protein AAFF_G00224240 [Aldrovandia affinis]
MLSALVGALSSKRLTEVGNEDSAKLPEGGTRLPLAPITEGADNRNPGIGLDAASRNACSDPIYRGRDMCHSPRGGKPTHPCALANTGTYTDTLPKDRSHTPE